MITAGCWCAAEGGARFVGEGDYEYSTSVSFSIFVKDKDRRKRTLTQIKQQQIINILRPVVPAKYKQVGSYLCTGVREPAVHLGFGYDLRPGVCFCGVCNACRDYH